LWLFFLGSAQVAVSTRAITDLSRYQEIRESYQDSPLIQHFPETFPPAATDIRLEYLPKFLQGGSHFIVSYILPSEQINEIRIQADEIAKYKYRTGESNQLTDELPDDIPKPPFQIDTTTAESSSQTYEVFILDVQAAGGAGSEWNHGYSYGIAIDDVARRVIYWHEYW